MLIPCPICGPRDQSEFLYGGDAAVVRPDLSDRDPSNWMRYVYDRDNPRGPHREYWQHVHGCRSTLIVERDTLTHDTGQVELIGQPARLMNPPAENAG